MSLENELIAETLKIQGLETMTEDAFLKALFERLPSPPGRLVIPPGDDCAGYALGGGKILLVAVDQIVEKRHYLADGPCAATPEQVGRKLLARNLSDIAAMGGKPLFCLVAASLGAGHDESWLNRFFNGILKLGKKHNVSLIGGDLATAPQDTVAALTIIGEVEAVNVCRRSGARPGDLLVATGKFGRSFQTGHHLSFEPRLKEGQWLTRNRFSRAMIDVSDGLLIDAMRLCRASGVGLRLETAAIPRRTADTKTEEALNDGEDHELLFAVPKRKAKDLVKMWPFARVAVTKIGEFFSADRPVVLDGRGVRLSGRKMGGFDHFKTGGRR
jgi:thiamine-monophosphate kinase